MLSNEEKEPVCLCSTRRPGESGVAEAKAEVVAAVEGSVECDMEARLRLRLTEVKKPLFLLVLLSWMELAGELPVGLELLGESRARPCSDCAELCRFRRSRSIV